MEKRRATKPTDAKKPFDTLPRRSRRSDTARLLGCSVRTVQRLEEKKRLTKICDVINGRVYHPMAEVMALVTGHAPDQVVQTAECRKRKRK